MDEKRLIDLEGTLGTLVAEVVDPRPPEHVGDWFHGVYPEMPARGELIGLGTGVLFCLPPVEADFTPRVGLLPVEDRETLWLDLKALYRTHSQQVRIWFQPTSARKKDVVLTRAKRAGLEPKPKPGGDFVVIIKQVPLTEDVPGQAGADQKG